MMRSYLGLSVLLSFCLVFVVACSDDTSNEPGSGGAGGNNGGGGAGGSMGPGVETRAITFGCSNNANGATSIIPGQLRVDVGEDPIAGGSTLTANLTGTLAFPEVFLDTAQSVIPGGVAAAQLVVAQGVVQVRSGATQNEGDDLGVLLPVDVEQLEPGEISVCNFSLGTCSVTTTQTCPNDEACPDGETCEGGGNFVKECDQANDNADGSNPDCLPVSPETNCTDPRILVEVPTSDDCAEGGVCEGLEKESQCEANGFCVTGGLEVALVSVDQDYTVDASGNILFGWADEGLPDVTVDEDGVYDIPQVIPGPDSQPVQGLSVLAGPPPGLAVAVSCVMAVDSAGPNGVATCDGGDNDGDPCTSPADLGNDVCFGGDNDGEACSSDDDCGGGAGGAGGDGGAGGAGGASEPGPVCGNVDCGPEGECTPTDEASVTPDDLLISFPIE